MKLNVHAIFAWIVIPSIIWGSALWLACSSPAPSPRWHGGHTAAQPIGPSLPSSPCQPVSPAPHGNLLAPNHD